MSFEGFSKAGLTFLAELGEHDKAWFDANRSTYDSEVVPAAKAFVAAMGDYLRANVSDAIEAQPKTNGSIAPINNDLRFNPDASPYKDHLMFRFWEGPVKKTSAMLMVRVHPPMAWALRRASTSPMSTRGERQSMRTKRAPRCPPRSVQS